MSASAQAVRTNSCSLGGLTSRHLFPTVLEAGGPRSRFPADLVSDEGPLPGLQVAFSWTLHGGGVGGERGGASERALVSL